MAIVAAQDRSKKGRNAGRSSGEAGHWHVFANGSHSIPRTLRAVMACFVLIETARWLFHST